MSVERVGEAVPAALLGLVAAGAGRAVVLVASQAGVARVGVVVGLAAGCPVMVVRVWGWCRVWRWDVRWWCG